MWRRLAAPMARPGRATVVGAESHRFKLTTRRDEQTVSVGDVGVWTVVAAVSGIVAAWLDDGFDGDSDALSASWRSQTTTGVFDRPPP